ncbi:MAG TPA: helix-turn-helix transcriptional regulator, partial [Vicinamibacterales bacterium]|nr:helix-turn-helix transcriptional regulator [Vicinamibacterales bacterium]
NGRGRFPCANRPEIGASRVDAFLRLCPAMNAAREAFGPNLRRARVQAGVSLQTIVDATNVSQTLWDGLESNDLSKWPNGVFARAFVKEYAKLVGLDTDATVDEFCRCFPQGDRRAEPVMRASAEIVNHDLEWQDHVPPAEGDRRASGSPAAIEAKPSEGLFSKMARFKRVFGRA